MRSNGHRGAILLVDDDDSIRRLVKVSLERAGYAVFVASDGVLGLALFKQRQREIALLLTDVAMPNMNGLELADRILELDETLPVVFMSATSGADRGNGCVSKPFLGAELIAKIGTVLRPQLVVGPKYRTDDTLLS